MEKSEKNEKNETKEIIYYDTILKTIEAGITSEKYYTADLDNCIDEMFETKKIALTMTTTKNQKNNINNNMTTIDLGECELLLIGYYNKANNTFYIKKLEIYEEGMKIKKVVIDVYFKTEMKLEKLNLSICEKSKISIYVPIILTENIDILNSSSGYYNDI